MKQVIEEFGRTVEDAAARLHAISAEGSVIPRAEGKWSPREIVGHLIDSAANNHLRFVRAQFVDHLAFEGYDQEDWVRAQDYAHQSWPHLIELWRHYNLHIRNVMTATPVETLTRQRTHHTLHRIAWQTIPEDQPVTLEYFMRDYIGHMNNHLAQIFDEE